MGRPKKEEVQIHEMLEQSEIVIDAEPVSNPVVGSMVVGEDEKAPAFPTDKYFLTVEDEIDVSDDPRYPDFQIIEKQVLRREFVKNPHRIKCRIRAAKHYNVETNHLQEAYRLLSGKKIDGIIINSLIDRFGFSDGVQKNRQSIAKEFNINYAAVDVADDKLKTILAYKDVLKKYRDYLNTFTTESKHDIERDSFNV